MADPNYQDGTSIGTSIVAATFVGDLSSAVARAEERLSWSGRDLTPRQRFGLGSAAYAARETGAPDTARRYLAISRESQAAGLEWLTDAAFSGGVTALLDFDEGSEGALERLAAAVARQEAMSAPTLAAALLLDLAELASSVGDDRAGFAVQRLADIAALLERDVYRAMARIADAYATPGAEQRTGLAREALALLEPLDLPLLQGRANDVLGRGVMETDPASAREAFARAVTEFDSCGAVGRRDRAAAELERLAP
jgi:hypothetical protein